MASVLRIGLIRIAPKSSQILSGAIVTPSIQQKCNISGRTMRGGQPLIRPKPFDYKNKKYNGLTACFDKTTHRFDENSKVIVVEGPPAVNKSQFAKQLADELEMLHFPKVTMDNIYINSYGYDLRQLDPQLPVNCRSFDIKNFCENPNHRNVAQYQIRMYMLKYAQYIDALAHLLSTGQGVVLERSPFSDLVFLETLYKHNYVSKGARSIYYELRHNSITELLKPHLVIYLDVPAQKVKENIQKRNISYEAKSKVFTEEYLTDLESFYKQEHLKDISTHSELLVYDWSNGGETEIVVEDVERIDFDNYEFYSPKMRDWKIKNEWDWCEVRQTFSNEKADLMNNFNVPRYDVPELLQSPEDEKKFADVWYNAPGMKYSVGYNTDMGDTGKFEDLTIFFLFSNYIIIFIIFYRNSHQKFIGFP